MLAGMPHVAEFCMEAGPEDITYRTWDRRWLRRQGDHLTWLCRHWPVRSYPWGKAEALCSLHSDVPALKRLLLELSFDDIKVHYLPLLMHVHRAHHFGGRGFLLLVQLLLLQQLLCPPHLRTGIANHCMLTDADTQDCQARDRRSTMCTVHLPERKA